MISEVLYDLLVSDQTYQTVKDYLSEPKKIGELANYMGWTENETELFVVVATLAVKNAVKLFDARYHMFLRATDSVFVTLGDMGATASAVSPATPQGTVHRAAGHRQAERLSGRPERTG